MDLIFNQLTLNYRQSLEWAQLQQTFSSGITQNELSSIAMILEKTLNLPHLPRESRRTFSSLMNWYIANWNQILPVLRYIKLIDDNYNMISGETQILQMRQKIINK